MTTACRTLSLLVCLALTATGCGGDDETGGGPTGDPPSALVTGTNIDAEAAEQLLAEFDGLDAAAQEQRAADVDRELERATWTVSGLDEAVGTERADEVFDAVNSGIRVDLAVIGAQLGGIEAFGTGAPSRLDELSEAQGASLFGAAMISALSADAAAGLVDGVHTGSGTTPEGVTISATKDTGTMSLQLTKTIDGVVVEIGTSVKIAPCPDATGKAVAEGSMNASASKGGVGHKFSYGANVEIQVGDDAEVASTTESFTAEQGDVSGGKEQYVAVSVDSEGHHEVTQTRGDLPADYTQQAVNGALIMSRLLAGRLVRAAEERWKSGRCVKLQTAVSDGPSGVRPGSSIAITAAPRSAIDGAPVGGTVTARLSAGAAGVEPSDTKVKADATFTYTAPPEAQQTGEVALEARSRRGVAKASVRFDTYPLSFAAEGGGGDFHGSGVICDLREPFTISGSGLTLNFTPADRTGGSYTLSGSAGGATWSGGGTYKVKLNGSGRVDSLKTKGVNTVTTPLGSYSDTAVAEFALRFVHACD